MPTPPPGRDQPGSGDAPVNGSDMPCLMDSRVPGTEQVERLLDRLPIFLGDKDGAAGFALDLDGFALRKDIGDKTVEVLTGRFGRNASCRQ